MGPLRALSADQRGLSTVEYILILVIVAITALLLWQTFGSSVGSRVDQATEGVASMDGSGRARGGPSGSSAGTETAAAITEGRASEGEGAASTGTAMGSAGGATAEGGAATAEGGAAVGTARRVGAVEGDAAGFGDGGEGAEAVAIDDGPDLFLWIGWLIVLVLGAVTLFSVLGKRAGKG